MADSSFEGVLRKLVDHFIREVCDARDREVAEVQLLNNTVNFNTEQTELGVSVSGQLPLAGASVDEPGKEEKMFFSEARALSSVSIDEPGEKESMCFSIEAPTSFIEPSETLNVPSTFDLLPREQSLDSAALKTRPANEMAESRRRCQVPIEKKQQCLKHSPAMDALADWARKNKYLLKDISPMLYGHDNTPEVHDPRSIKKDDPMFARPPLLERFKYMWRGLCHNQEEKEKYLALRAELLVLNKRQTASTNVFCDWYIKGKRRKADQHARHVAEFADMYNQINGILIMHTEYLWHSKAPVEKFLNCYFERRDTIWDDHTLVSDTSTKSNLVDDSGLEFDDLVYRMRLRIRSLTRTISELTVMSDYAKNRLDRHDDWPFQIFLVVVNLATFLGQWTYREYFDDFQRWRNETSSFG